MRPPSAWLGTTSCRMIFFSLDTDGTIVRVVSGEKIGTTVHA